MPQVQLKEVRKGIYQLRIPLPFRLNHVNSYLIEGEAGWTVIDAGLNNRDTEQIWEELLKTYHVEKIIITHYHPDHYGYAGELQRKTGAPVLMSRIEAEMARQFWSQDNIKRLEHYYLSCGLPDTLKEQLMGKAGDLKAAISEHPEVSRLLEDGEVVRLGDKRYEVIITPGHSDGMVCFYQPEEQYLFSADHILPRITPNITYWPGATPNPLQSYLEALQRVKTKVIDLVIPSHGDPFYGVEERIEQLLAHHDERLAFLLEQADSWLTIHQACQRLFSQSLSIHDLRFAIGETVAHLEYLTVDGQLEKQIASDGTWLYQRK